jgi:hypothetical protein
MQLSPSPRPAGRQRRRQLALAALALLGGGTAQAEGGAAAPGAAVAPVDSGLLWYQESDHRIKDVEAIVGLREPLAQDRAWSLRLTLDAVCGGSPIGALPSKTVQNFFTPTASTLAAPAVVQTTTSSSGGGGGLGSGSLCSNPVQNQHYSVSPGALPIDQSFHDQRIALAAGFETPLDPLSRLSLGGALSHETDFFSTSLSAQLAHDFNNRNTTLSGGLNLESDTISPVGGTPLAGSTYGLFDKTGNQHRNGETAVLGLTQVMTRRWLTQGSFSTEHASGYETDPYKIVSLLDAQGLASANPLADYVYERRPGSRNRWSLFWDNRYAFDGAVLQASYRRTGDSWGVHSDTFDMHLRVGVGSGYFEPHLREYRQSAADFFHFYLDSAAALPADFSADPRLAAFHGQTLGLKYGLPMDDRGGEFSVRVERYTQRGSGLGGTVPVGLQGLDVFPGMSAWIVQLGARFSF